MEVNLTQTKAVLASIAGVVASLFGGFDYYLGLLLMIMLIDIVTGLIYAIEKKSLSSAIMRRGVLNKVIILMLVALGVVIDRAFATELSAGITIGGFTLIIRNCVIFWFCVEEGISVLENCSKLGVPVPKVIKQLLECIESGVSNSTPSDIIDFLKKHLGIDISFGKDKRKDEIENNKDEASKEQDDEPPEESDTKQ